MSTTACQPPYLPTCPWRLKLVGTGLPEVEYSLSDCPVGIRSGEWQAPRNAGRGVAVRAVLTGIQVRNTSAAWAQRTPDRLAAMARWSHGKALEPRSGPAGLNVFELIVPDRSGTVPHVLTLSELADAVKANRRRRTLGRPHGAPHPRPVGLNVFELLVPDRSRTVPEVLTLSELADAVKANRRRRTLGRPHGAGRPSHHPSALEVLELNHDRSLGLSSKP